MSELRTCQGRRQRGASGARTPHLKSVPPISRLAHRLLHTSNTVFLKCGPSFWFLAPLLLILATGLALALSVSRASRSRLCPDGPRVHFFGPAQCLHAQLYTFRSRGVSRGERGTIPGRRITLEVPKSPNNVTSTFFNTVHLLPKYLRFEHGGGKLASCPGPHLTALRPCTRPKG